MRKYYFGLIFISCIFAGAVIYGFSMIGNPIVVRGRKLDSRRIESLSQLAYYIERYFKQKNKLPYTLNDLQKAGIIGGGSPESKDSIFLDPVTKQKYGYKILGQFNYQLCAKFSYSSNERGEENTYLPYYHGRRLDYQRGYHCINFKITPSIYSSPSPPPFPSLPPRVLIDACGRYASATACDAAAAEGESCAWYACRNVCLTTGTSIEAVCGGGRVEVAIPTPSAL